MALRLLRTSEDADNIELAAHQLFLVFRPPYLAVNQASASNSHIISLPAAYAFLTQTVCNPPFHPHISTFPLYDVQHHQTRPKISCKPRAHPRIVLPATIVTHAHLPGLKSHFHRIPIAQLLPLRSPVRLPRIRTHNANTNQINAPRRGPAETLFGHTGTHLAGDLWPLRALSCVWDSVPEERAPGLWRKAGSSLH